MSTSETKPVTTDLKALIKLPLTSSIISTVLGIIILIIGVTVFASWIYAMVMYLLVGLMLLIFAIIGTFRLSKANDVTRAGEVCITHGWWIFSTGVGGIMVYVAPFFTKEAPALGALAAIASALAMVLGLIIVIHAKRKMGVRLTV
ncbi:MAG: hypothetical protein DRO15_00840 [Thermoprotei archaeon]|nr:MAG: hypothetical protein DRO15_00840 [Thermoprotei archaeon]